MSFLSMTKYLRHLSLISIGSDFSTMYFSTHVLTCCALSSEITTLCAMLVILAITAAVKHDPIIMRITENQRSLIVFGVMSPKPTVVRVVRAQYTAEIY